MQGFWSEEESHWESVIEGKSNREKHLQLLLFIYRTTRHTSMGLSPSEVLFSVNPSPLQIPRLSY